MSKKIRLIITIFALSFLFSILFAACAPATAIERDFFVDYEAVVKEVPFGTPLSLDGLIVKVKMTDGTFVTLARGGEGYVVDDDGYERETPGTYSIAISYKDFASVSFYITILEEEIIDENDNSDIVVTGISVQQNAGKRLFLFGEEFSTQGIVVKKIFSDNTSLALIPQQYEINSESYKADKAGNYTISVRYTDGQKTFTDAYTVTVTPEVETILTKITLKTDAVKTQYFFGEDISFDGLVVEKWYSTDDVIITEYANSEEYTVDTSAYNKTMLGYYDIIVSMEEATGVSASYEVKVNDFLHHITATQNKGIFDLGEEFVAEGLVVYEYMASGDYTMAEPVNYTLDSNAFNSSEEGTYTIRVYQTNNPTMFAEYTVKVMDIPDL